MTFSIVGRSADGSALGVAVASKFLGVGAAVPARAGVGAVATQSAANLAYRPQALALLGTGVDAASTVAGLIAADDGPVSQRQVGVVGVSGAGASYTGADCFSFAGGVAGDDGYAIQGNMLTGPSVVSSMEAAWTSSPPSAPLPARLLAALRAGDAAGGDRRGRQSAALLVVSPGRGYGGTSDVWCDLRVDDHADPLSELARLLDRHRFYFEPPDPATLIPLSGDLADEVRTRLATAGFTGGDALESWAGVENLEMRIVPDAIDPLVLAHLRAAT